MSADGPSLQWTESRRQRAIRVVKDGWLGYVAGNLLLPIVAGLLLAAQPTKPGASLGHYLFAFGKGFGVALVIVLALTALYAVLWAASLQRREARSELQRRDSFEVRFELARCKPLRDQTGEVAGYILQLAVTNAASAGKFTGRAKWLLDGEPLGDPWFACWAQSEGMEREREIGFGDTDILQVTHVLKCDKKLTDSGWIVYPKLPGDVDTSDVLQRTRYRLRDDHKDPIGGVTIAVRVRRIDIDAYEEREIGFEADESGEPLPKEVRSSWGPPLRNR